MSVYTYTYMVIGYSNNGRCRRRRSKKGPKGSLPAAKRRNVFHLIGLWIIMHTRPTTEDASRKSRAPENKIMDPGNRYITRRRHVPLVGPAARESFIYQPIVKIRKKNREKRCPLYTPAPMPIRFFLPSCVLKIGAWIKHRRRVRYLLTNFSYNIII